MCVHLQRFVPALIVSCVVVLLPPRLPAQEKPKIVEISIAGKQKMDVKSLDLRPNRPTAIGIVLKNAGDEKLTDVTAKLVQVIGADDYRTLAEATIKELKGDTKAALKFEKAKDGPKEGDLVGAPPFKIQLHVKATRLDKAESFKSDLDLNIGEPGSYILPAPKAEFTETSEKTKRLSIVVTDGIPTPGPHKCVVQIVLGPELEPTKSGVQKDTLDKLKDDVELFVDGLKLAKGMKKARVFLKVDDYDRAFTYEMPLEGIGTATAKSFATKVGVNIPIRAYMKPSENFVIPMELDGPLSDNLRVEVALDRAGNKARFKAVPLMVGLRQKKLGVSVSPGNHLIVQNKVSDWRPVFDTDGTTGAMWLRLQVFKVDEQGVKLAAEALDVPTALPGHAEMEYDPLNKFLYVRIIQDDSPVEGIVFDTLPADKEWIVGKPLPVKVAVSPRTANQAPIEKAILFKGKAPKEKEEIKPDDIIGEAIAPDKDGKWSFEVPAQGKAEAMPLSVQFITKTGAKAAKTETITYKAAGTTTGSKTLATIKGVLMYGDNALQKQSVLLLDAKDLKKKPLETVESNDKGAFVFKSVPPGVYLIWSSPRFGTDVLVGSKEIEVKDGADQIDAKTLNVLLK